MKVVSEPTTASIPTRILPSTERNAARPRESLNPDEARALAQEAYVYGFPLVDNYRIQCSYFVNQSDPEFKATWNKINNTARVYTPADNAVQSPNSDTPYSQLGCDLRAEPLVLTFPNVEKERYYSAQFVDAYTHNFAYVGSRATGNEAGSFLLTGPGWNGEKPAGIRAVIRSETQFVFVLYRTQLFGPGDIEKVKMVQAGYNVQTLSEFLGQPRPPAPPQIDFFKPLSAEKERTSLEFFSELNFILRFCPAHPSETALMNRLGRLGIGANGNFDPRSLSTELRKAVQDGMADAWKTFNAFKSSQVDSGKVTSGDCVGSREHLKNKYLYRMAAAVLGIYGNSKEEAVYPVYFVDAEGRKLDGARRYSLHFGPGELPPVNAFWSLTLYELPSSLLYANPLDRYLINSPMLPDLRRDADGGLTLHIQHDPPGVEKQPNWLPAPIGPFFLALRLYWPRLEAVNGPWSAPLLQAAKVRRLTQRIATPTEADGVLVTPDNFRRAESNRYFDVVVKEGGFGKFFHHRDLASIDEPVIRPNRDTLYSPAIFDLDAGLVTITLPEAGNRFRSMQVIDEDQYSPLVAYGAGTYTLSRDKIGTRYVMVAIRTLVDPARPDDLQQVYKLQDATKVEQNRTGHFQIPNWNSASQAKVREALLLLGSMLSDTQKMFGPREEVDPARHLIGTAMAWGGNPAKHALYLNVTPGKNDGTTIYRLTVKDVPVDGFWSISIYNSKGHFEPNEHGIYTLNNLTAKKSADGSVHVQFGEYDGVISNCLPVVAGWNYTVRLYRPRTEVLNGEWKFPEARPVR